MTRNEFEKAMAEQRTDHAKERAAARRGATACDVVTMYAFGGTPYCRAHGVMGPCPYGDTEAGKAIAKAIEEAGGMYKEGR